MRVVYMDDEVKNALVKYVNENVIAGGSLQIEWYGGEPLLALDIIEELTKQFLDICKRENIDYTASIVTNGYLLTQDVMKKLLELKIKSVQIL